MSAAAGRVLRLWRYPVKSMGGEACTQLELDSGGVAGDRAYALRTADGRLGSGKNTRRFRQVDGLLAFGAGYGSDGAQIRFPDGRVLDTRAPDIDAALSAALGEPVTLTSASTAHVDAGPVHLLTSASLAWLRARLPASSIDERRFRANVVIDVAGSAPVEQSWIGRTLAFDGGARLRVEAPTERCRMVTLAQAELPDDARVLRALAEAVELMFGVYAVVEAPGRIACGEEVELV